MSAPLPVRGSAFGFDIHSPYPFETLRPAAGLPPLRVVAASEEPAGAGGVLVAEISEPGFVARIFKDGDDYDLWVDRVGWFRIDPLGACVEAPTDCDPFEREELVLGVPALLCFLERGDASLHAAVVEVDGRALLFVAPQAGGKSTLSAAFARRGYGILSEDVACIRLGSPPVVLPGPASLRLRTDVATVLGSAFRCVREGRERTRYTTGLLDGSDVPIAALILLRPSLTDSVYLADCTPVRALPDLWGASFRLTRSHELRSFAAIATLAETVPVYELYRPLRFDALDRTVDAAVEEFSRSGASLGRLAQA